MEINALFNVFQMMIVQVHIHVVRGQVRKFVQLVGSGVGCNIRNGSYIQPICSSSGKIKI